MVIGEKIDINNNNLIIAVDGFSVTGKSMVATFVAEKYDMYSLDSGLLYCVVAHKLAKANIQKVNSNRIVAMLNELEINEDGTIYHDGHKIDADFFTDEFVLNKVTYYAHKPNIRKGINQFIRNYAKNKSIVVNGRDIGSVVLPEAQIKFLFWIPGQDIDGENKCSWLSDNSIKRNRLDYDNIEKPDQLGEDDELIDVLTESSFSIKDIVVKKIDNWINHHGK